MNDIVKYTKSHLAALIVVPFIIYITIFVCHFVISGSGDGFFSPQFQLTLDIANNSVVIIRGCDPRSNYLHSHDYVYPKEHGPQQQQVGYGFVDPNSYWIITKLNGSTTVTKLYSIRTGRNLHSHNEKAPFTTDVFQVSGYGKDGLGDDNDFWKVKILKNYPKHMMIPMLTKFSLHHIQMGCELMFSGIRLPKWAAEQEETICNNNMGHPKSCWSFAYNNNDDDQIERLDITNTVKSGWISRIVEYHRQMFSVNNALVPKPHEIPSKPWMWPINFKGIWFSGKSEHRVYLLGNPIIWWICFFVVLNYPIVYVLMSLYSLRYPNEPISIEWKNCDIRKCWPVFMIWAFNYIPYFFMGRVLYYHHYFPSYHFSCVISGVVLNWIVVYFHNRNTSKKSKQTTTNSFTLLHIFICLILTISFYHFCFLSYGMTGNIAAKVPQNSTYTRYRWLRSWEF